MKTLLLPSPITDITPLPHSTASVMLCTATRASRSETGAAWHWTGWLLARAGYVSPCCNVMCLWYMCFCAEVFFFSVLRLYSKWSIVWGLKIFFPPLSPHVKSCISKYPVSCSVYPVVICMLCMYGQVDG